MTRSLARLLAPRSVAVVGASPKPGSVAGTILSNLRACGFAGKLMPVNPKYEEVLGLPCIPTIADLPDDVDLVVLAINRSIVLDAVAACGAKGLTNLIIITAGFKEAGDVGLQLERELKELIERYDLSVVGPNCMGLINSSQETRLNASFSRWFPPGGEIAFISQSGSLGETLLECFEDAGLGVGRFVNLGNRAGLSENDFLAHFAEDDACGAIFLYLESFAEPAEFRRLVSEIGKRKPIVVLKAGRTEAGAAAVASHTGSLASPDAIVDAFLRQCGAIRVTTIEETLTALRALERGVHPAAPSTVILTNAGGAGIIAADACERVGIDVPPLSDATREALSAFLPPEAGLGNPVDMIATAGSVDYERALDVVLREADAAIVIFRPPLVYRESVDAVAEGILRISSKSPGKVILVSTLSTSETVKPLVERLRRETIPTYAMPETAVEALSVLVRTRRIRDERAAADHPVVRNLEMARRVIDGARSEGRAGLTFEEGTELLGAYGIDVCPFRYVERPEEGIAFATEVGYPIVAKVDSPELFHRFEKGAVLTGIADAEGLRASLDALKRIIVEHGLAKARILLQKTLLGRELIFGLEQDPAFGPVVMFGLGGTFVEALKDVAFAVAPITTTTAERTIRSIRAFPLLEAFRGQPAADLDPLAHTLAALGQLGLDFPQIEEVDLNPVIADEHGASAVDILIRLTEEGC